MNPISQIKLEREDKRIKLTLPYNPTYIKKIKTIPGYRWHPDKKCWSFPYSEDILKKILLLFDGENIHLDSTLQRLTEETGKNKDFEVLRRELVSRKYSPKTIKAYLHYNRDMLKLTNKSPFDVKDSDIKDYLLYLVEKKKAATSTLNIAINALKFYYGMMLKRKFLYEIKRPRKDKRLPVVLSRKEIAKILSSVNNIKHKTILMLIYSAGLRISEVVKLRLEDIDSQRKLIYIKASKGRKDRYTILSEVSLNALSYSFATHLLENGIDLRYIQELLGHKHSKTTEIYTFVSRKFLGKIKSPLDTIKGGEYCIQK